MEAPAQTLETPAGPGALGLWVRNLFCFFVPGVSLVHLVSGPHEWPAALGFLAALLTLEVLERIPQKATAAPPKDLPAWPFTGVLYALAAIQFANVTLLCMRLSEMGWGQLDSYVAIIWVGSASSSGIVLGHELIHRPRAHAFQLGRLVMASVLYEHFATEHVRGHHPSVGTEGDPATARFGEHFWPFFRRTVPGQFRSALQLDTTRLGLAGKPAFHPVWLRHRVVQGLLLQAMMLVAIAVLCGPLALTGFLLQAFLAVVGLEAVNYFEHWGIRRTGRAIEPIHSWDSDAWFTQYSLVGLSRHADHHIHSSRPYHRLELRDESPKLPVSYGLMVNMVIFQNRKCRQLLTKELERCGLAPPAA